MVVYDDAEGLDITGPLDVFATANQLVRDHGNAGPLYRLEIAAAQKDAAVTTSSGIRLLADASWRDSAGMDTLLVAGGRGALQVPQELVEWLRRSAPGMRRVGSICTGAFILARAGLLDGRRAATHWCRAEQLRRSYPQIDVEEDAIYVKDGAVYTSAGVTAGIDLALALLEEDHGLELALQVARDMVLYVKRPGGQSQLSTRLIAQFREGGVLAPTVRWIRDNYRDDLTNEALAAHAAMSLRNFARVFRRETGTTPARFIERTRLEAVVRLLEETGQALKSISQECGFQSGEHFRLAFTRRFGITPGQYRERFRGRRD